MPLDGLADQMVLVPFQVGCTVHSDQLDPYQLKHEFSNKYIHSTPKRPCEKQRHGFLTFLDENNSKAAQFRFLPKYRLNKEGDTSLGHYLQATEPFVYYDRGKRSELVCSVVINEFTVVKRKDNNTIDGDSSVAIWGGSVLQLNHKHLGAYLCADMEDSKQNFVHLHEYGSAGTKTKSLYPPQSSATFWQILPEVNMLRVRHSEIPLSYMSQVRHSEIPLSYMSQVRHSEISLSYMSQVRHSEIPLSYMSHVRHSEIPLSYMSHVRHSEIPLSYMSHVRHSETPLSYMSQVRHSEIPLSYMSQVRHSEIPLSYMSQVRHSEIPLSYMSQVRHSEIPLSYMSHVRHSEIPLSYMSQVRHSEISLSYMSQVRHSEIPLSYMSHVRHDK
ncbi:hypothetical protein LSH36_220g02000 [Paralvinella palmiformis]|uniref:Uncharacterized protein n=1 Tax=Paralvinella palmiformis TaxID=53620 RepID=A0AAD9JQ95_9ANNE|nr:hypothetical protein LSH36_220g02000 [Paralvinella palmiformis]